MAEAGKYVLKDLLWDERVNGVQETVPIFKRHLQGEVLDLDEGEATRLVDAGSVEKEGEAQIREANAAVARARAALANIPDHLRHLVQDVDPERLANREVPQEELTVTGVNAAPGFTNVGSPKYAQAAHGEGGVGEGLEEAGDEVGTTEDLDHTSASLDDGTKEAAGSREVRTRVDGEPVEGSTQPQDEGGRRSRRSRQSDEG